MKKPVIAIALFALCFTSMRNASAEGQAQIAQDGASVKQMLHGPLHVRPNDIHELEFDFPIGEGEHLHTLIKFTMGSLLNRRVVLLLPGPVENINTYNYEVPGFNATDILANAGFTAVAMDPYGNAKSSKPTDGTVPTIQAISDRYTRAIDRLKFVFRVDSVDIYGEGGMGGLACLVLARDPARAHSCSSSGQLYKYPSPFVQANLFSPFVYFSLINAITPSPFNTTNGYLDTVAIAPIIYGGATIGVDPAVAALTMQLQPEIYPTGYFLEGFKVVGIPSGTPEVVIDPSQAKVPGLVITDQFDVVSLPGDNEELVDDYGSIGGGEATLAVIAGSSAHAPRLGITEGNGPDSPFWQNLLGFLNSIDD